MMAVFDLGKVLCFELEKSAIVQYHNLFSSMMAFCDSGKVWSFETEMFLLVIGEPD